MIAEAGSGDGAAAGARLLFAPLRPVVLTLRPTRSGRVLVVMTAAAFVLAWFGAGIVFSVVAMFGGALTLVAAIATWRHASAVRIAAPPPVTAFAGERFVLDVPAANLARKAVAFDVLFAMDDPDWGAARIGALVPRIDADAEANVEVTHPALRRGQHRQGTLEVSSEFPLGLFVCRLRFELPNGILVLPRLGTLRRIESRDAHVKGSGGYGSKGRSDEQEVYGIRSWREGEALRSVHWKLSARRGRLLVREFRAEPRPLVHVVLSLRIDEDTRRTRNAFEDAVSLAATLVEGEVRSGQAVRLTLSGNSPRTVACTRGHRAMFPVLRALAQTSAEVRPGPPESVPRSARSRAGETTYLVRVVSGDGATRLRTADGAATVFEVSAAGTSVGGRNDVFDRRRRPGRELLLGVRR